MPYDPFAYMDSPTGNPTAPRTPARNSAPAFRATPVADDEAISAPTDPFAYMGDTSDAPTIPPPPSTSTPQGDPRDIGFGRALWQTINPVESIQGLGTLREGAQQARSEVQARHNQYLADMELATDPEQKASIQEQYDKDIAAYALNSQWNFTKGIGQGLYATGKDIFEDFTQGRVGTGFGKVTGLFGPGLAFRGLRSLKYIPPPPAATQAANRVKAIQSGLPTTTMREAQTALHDVGRSASAEAFSTWETARKSARAMASKAYEQLNDVLNHPNNTAPEGFPLRAEVKVGRGKNAKVKRSSITTDTPVQAPIPTAPFSAELEAIMDAQRNGMLPAKHPLSTFLKNIDAEVKVVKQGKKTKIKRIGLGFDYVRFMDMKKALGELKVMIDTPGVGWGPEKLLAKNIIAATEGVMVAEARKLATAAGKNPDEFIAALANADRQWASALRPFAKSPKGVAGSKQAFTEERAILGEQFPYPKPDPRITDIEEAIRTISPTNVRAQHILNTSRAVVSKQAGDAIRYITNSITNLENYLDVWRVGKGIDVTKDVLGQLLTHVCETKSWHTLKNLKPEVLTRLTRHDPALAKELPQLMRTLEEAEAALGPEVTQTLLGKAAMQLGKAAGADGTKLAFGSLSTRLQGLAGLLKKASTTKLLNIHLTTEVTKQLRYPKTTKLVGGAALNTGAYALQGTRRERERQPEGVSLPQAPAIPAPHEIMPE